MKCNNIILYNARISLGLSRKKVAYETGISSLYLKNVEEGYIPLLQKKKKILYAYYGIDENEYNALDYPGKIKEEGKKEKKFLQKFFKIYKSIYTVISLLAIVVISLCVCIPSYFLMDDVVNNKIKYTNQSYLQFKDEMYEKGDLVPSPMQLMFFDLFSYKFCEENADAPVFYIISNEKLLLDSMIIQKYVLEDKSIEVYMGTYEDRKTYDCSVQIKGTQDKSNKQYYFSYAYGTKKYSFSYFYDAEGNEYKSTDEELIDLEKKSYEIFDKFLIDCNNSFNNLFSFEIDFFQFIDEKIQNTEYQAKLYSTYFGLLSGFSIGGLLALFSLLPNCFMIGVKVAKKIKKNTNIKNEKNDEISKKPCKSPIKNLNFRPFFKEGYFAILAITIFFIGNLTLALKYYSALFFGATSPQELSTFINVIENFIPIGFLMILFVKLNKMSRIKTIYINGLAFMLSGFLFYIVELLITYDFMRSGMVFSILTVFFPGNIFWNIGLFLFISSFLFITPKRFKTKWQIIMYRLLAIIPIGLFVISYVLNVEKGLGHINISIFGEYLLISRNIVVGAFGILYLLGMFVVKTYIEHRYGKEEAPYIENGAISQYVKNGIAVLIIIILAILDNTLNTIESAKLLGFGKNKYIYVAIPFILFYSRRLPKKNIIQDMTFNTLAGVGNCLSYILIILSII